MSFRCGIVGLPNVGKSTLFNAMTSARAPASNYPFCTIDPNIGIVPLPDPRLDLIASAYRSAEKVPSTIEFVDIAGLVRGASTGEGLGNQFLAHIREVDAIAHVVRCFDDPNIIHVDGSIDPARDIGVLEAELMLKDLETVEKKLSEAARKAKSGDRKARTEEEFYLRVRDHIRHGRPAGKLSREGGDEYVWLRDCHLLTDKPVMYVCNVGEKDALGGNAYTGTVTEIALREGFSVVTVCAALEAEVSELPAEERGAFLRGLGLEESGLSKVVREGYRLLSLITFFTAGEKEAHARSVVRGTRAPRAAGQIHSEFEKGFIRAEIIKFDDLRRLGTESAVREAGLLALEGKDYVMQEGDIAHFRFNV